MKQNLVLVARGRGHRNKRLNVNNFSNDRLKEEKQAKLNLRLHDHRWPNGVD